MRVMIKSEIGTLAVLEVSELHNNGNILKGKSNDIAFAVDAVTKEEAEDLLTKLLELGYVNLSGCKLVNTKLLG